MESNRTPNLKPVGFRGMVRKVDSSNRSIMTSSRRLGTILLRGVEIGFTPGMLDRVTRLFPLAKSLFLSRSQYIYIVSPSHMYLNTSVRIIQ
jgi:hypothetical protein